MGDGKDLKFRCLGMMVVHREAKESLKKCRRAPFGALDSDIIRSGSPSS